MSFFGAGEEVGHLAYDGQGEDAYGNTVDSWKPEVKVPGVGLDVQTAQEVTGSSVVSTQVVGMTAFLPPSWAGKAHDRIRARGAVYEVEGEPVEARNAFTGETYGVVANLKRVTG